MSDDLKDISAIRENYSLSTLDKEDLSDDPIVFFKSWLEAALKAALPEPTAMTLSSISKEGKPSSRIVLLKEITTRGFVFYTNYDSKKGQEISLNSNVSLCFHWKELQRQVRIEGVATKVSKQKSETYHRSRPKKSQMGAWVSNQSATISDRKTLEAKMRSLQEKYKDADALPLPANWGGYEIVPNYYEFWQGRRSRLHDRLAYTFDKNDWFVSRLAP